MKKIGFVLLGLMACMQLVGAGQAATASKNADAEKQTYMERYQYYKYRSDLPKMQACLKELKAVCYQSQSYAGYFQVWSDILQFYNVRGDTENARIEAVKMEEEARRVDCEEGLMYAKISMARSVGASKKEEEAIGYFREALKSKAMKPMTRVSVHGEIAMSYLLINQCREAIEELQIQKSVLQEIIDGNPEYEAALRENLLEMELTFCMAYDGLDDAPQLLLHLQEARKYYTPDCFFSNYIGYHAYWGAYYRMTRKWEDCFREFDTALAYFDDTLPLHEMIILRMKGKALTEAGRHKDAALLYKALSIKGDSLNHDVMKLHQETLQANYHIRKALLDKERLVMQYNWITVGLVALMIVTVWLMAIRAHRTRQTLRRSERETREALETVDAANKMKEIFLHNIVHQIREPLNVVVGFSDILATEKGLTVEEMTDYSTSIKKNADLLFQLIIDVLDLSRLESGMMKFSVAECDAVQMCRDAEMAVKMQDGNRVRLSFRTDLEVLNIRTDSGRFMKLLLTVLASTEDGEGEMDVMFTLSKEDKRLKIVVGNSPLLRCKENIQRIKHDINRLFLESFKGTYQWPQDGGEGDIIVTYPA